MRLVVTRGDTKGKSFRLEEGENLVGRWDPDAGSFPEIDLESEDPEAKVSRKHAIIVVSKDRITIRDIGSLNGTYVNRGPRLEQDQIIDLKEGDEVVVGKTFLRIEQ